MESWPWSRRYRNGDWKWRNSERFKARPGTIRQWLTGGCWCGTRWRWRVLTFQRERDNPCALCPRGLPVRKNIAFEAFIIHIMGTVVGEMAEWFKAHAWKA